MATVETRPSAAGSLYRIRLSDGEHPDRPRIILGKVSKRQADTVKVHIEQLIACKTTGTVIPPATQDWLIGIPDAIRTRLEELDLITPRAKAEKFTVAAWMAGYMEKRTDIKQRTRENMQQVQSLICAFVSPDLPLEDFTPDHADDFRRFLLSKGQAESTIRRRCKSAKQFFASAVKRRLIASNPFDDVETANVANNSRQFYIDRPMIQRVIDACPNSTWRLIFALARYGGLRIPSELRHMTWDDIAWMNDRFTVRSPKTEHIDGKAQRSVPLFPELIPYFRDALQDSNPEDPLIFPELGKRSNLRTQAHRIIKRAGLVPWERVFQNLRSSRETELMEEFPPHVVTDWIGNSIDVANMHYLQTHEGYFKRAAKGSGAELGDVRGTDGGQNAAADRRTASQTKTKDVSQTLVFAGDNDGMRDGAENCNFELAPPRGIEPLLPG
jgi:integrase